MQSALIFAEHTLQHCRDICSTTENGHPEVTVSIGMTGPRVADDSFEEIIRRLDRVLYLAKSNGRNRIEMA
jgi:PleD family two-component response regulator